MAISDKLRKKLEKSKEGLTGGNYDTFLFKDGVNRIRVVNPGEDEDFAFEVINFFLGKDIGGVISPATFGEPCAIYETHKELKGGSDDDKELAETFFPSKKYAIPIYKYKDEKGTEVDDENGVKLVLAPKGVYDALLDLALDEEKDEFFNERKGYDVKVKRTGTGKTGTKYNVIECKSTPAHKKFKGVYNPEEMVRKLIPTYEETQKMINRFLNISDDEDEAPRKKKTSTTTKKKTSTRTAEAAPLRKKKRRTSDM